MSVLSYIAHAAERLNVANEGGGASGP